MRALLSNRHRPLRLAHRLSVTLLYAAILVALGPLAPFAYSQTSVKVEVARFPVTPVAQTTCANSAPHCATISWTAPTRDINGNPLTGVIAYSVLRTIAPAVPTTVIGPILTTTSYEDDAVAASTSYNYAVVAYQTVSGKVYGPSASSSQVTGTIPASGYAVNCGTKTVQLISPTGSGFLNLTCSYVYKNSFVIKGVLY